MLKKDFEVNKVIMPKCFSDISKSKLAGKLVTLPAPPKVGDILKVIGFKGEDPTSISLSCMKGDERVDIRIRNMVKGSKQTGITPDDVPCDPVIEEQYKDRLQYIYPLAVNTSYEDLFSILDGQTIICCGSMETPASYNGNEYTLTVWKFAILFDEE
ncbi:hypothetical protein [Odoribacter sp. AF15-53]|uniref:hypothetical protein n=1 Tax=Odoribacter sp. AF15-53 TaxID=2292236 RepID=UPI000E48517E|nr:hypothetical protein [Odoribacter sp. AF15-53]RHR75719.1 hypothetical protein DWW52_17210 [Odoribacter sp. AF15-53]